MPDITAVEIATAINQVGVKTQLPTHDLKEWVIPERPDNSETGIRKRLHVRNERIVERTQILQKMHGEICHSKLCQIGINRCETGRSLAHWENVKTGCLTAEKSMPSGDLVVFELLWEALETLVDSSKVTSNDFVEGVKPYGEKIELKKFNMHYLTIALRAYIGGNIKLARTWAVQGGLELPQGYVLPEQKVVSPPKNQAETPINTIDYQKPLI